MKVACECGNTIDFVVIENKSKTETMGKFTEYDSEKFFIWSQHGDEKGIKCKKCRNSIWFY